VQQGLADVHRGAATSSCEFTSGATGRPAFLSLICDSPLQRRGADQAQLAAAIRKIKT